MSAAREPILVELNDGCGFCHRGKGESFTFLSYGRKWVALDEFKRRTGLRLYLSTGPRKVPTSLSMIAVCGPKCLRGYMKASGGA